MKCQLDLYIVHRHIYIVQKTQFVKHETTMWRNYMLNNKQRVCSKLPYSSHISMASINMYNIEEVAIHEE